MYKCDKCGGTSPTSNTCENIDCPDMPCCGKPKEECFCIENLKETKEDIDNFWLEEARIANEKMLESRKQLDYVLKNINYPKDLIEQYVEIDDWQHEGYVEKLKEIKKYNKTFYQIKDKKFNLKLPFNKQTDVENPKFYSLVWQTVGYCEDDYSGYLMFPLKDGRHWLISYSC